MAKFTVELYPVMLLTIVDVEAEDVDGAIRKAVVVAQAQHLAANGDGSQGPVFAQEYARYIVTPVVDGRLDEGSSKTLLDAAFVSADERDLQAGFPLYEVSETAVDEVPSPPHS